MPLTLPKAQEITSALEDLCNRQATLYNDIRQVLDANSAQAPTWALPATVTVTGSNGSSTLTTGSVHGLSVGQKFQLVPVSPGGVLPGGFAAGTDYYVLTTPLTTTLTAAATRGGAAVVASSAGAATVNLQPLPDYLTLDANANLSGTKYSPNDVSNAIAALDNVRKLLGNVSAPAQGDYLGSLNKLTRPAG